MSPSSPLADTAVRQPVVPRATYRLQLNKDFGFDAARAVLPYLQRLGISPDLPAALAAMARTPADGRLKMWLAWRLLALRRDDPELVPARTRRRAALRRPAAAPCDRLRAPRGPLHAAGAVGRKFVGLGSQAGTLPVGDALWSGTQLRKPDWMAAQALRGFDELNDREVEIAPGPLALAERFTHFPVSALRIDTAGPTSAAP